MESSRERERKMGSAPDGWIGSSRGECILGHPMRGGGRLEDGSERARERVAVYGRKRLFGFGSAHLSGQSSRQIWPKCYYLDAIRPLCALKKTEYLALPNIRRDTIIDSKPKWPGRASQIYIVEHCR